MAKTTMSSSTSSCSRCTATLDPVLLRGMQPLLKPLPAELLRAYPVSTRVNTPARDDAQCIEPLATDAGEDDLDEPDLFSSLREGQ